MNDISQDISDDPAARGELPTPTVRLGPQGYTDCPALGD
jgi:hypothetical protein